MINGIENNRNYIKVKKTKKAFKGLSEKLTVKDLSRLQTIYIPPAYKTLYLNKNPTNKVQLIAKDIKGRNQYFYNPEYTSKSDKRKYKALQSLVAVAEKIETDNKLQINRIFTTLSKTGKIDDTDYIHIIIWLLINNNFRIGNIKYDKLYNSSGITTLKPSHFKFNKGNKVCYISFIGKKGVENNAEIKDNKIIKILHNLKMRYGKHNNIDYIFSKGNGSLIKSDDITNYFNNKFNAKITPKMFRTYYANYHMLDYLQSVLDIKNNSEYNSLNSEKRKISYMKSKISEYVAERLHNTPSVCRNKYINNKLLNKVITNPHYYSGLGKNDIGPKLSIHQQLQRFIG
jgi:DNA topoisomerase-1